MEFPTTNAIPALCLLLAVLLGASGCQTVTYPPGAPEIISDFRSWTGVDGGKRRQSHRGIDTSGHPGQEILAAADGRVLETAVDKCWGPTIAIDHGKGRDGKRIVALYGHVGEMLVAEGDGVARGQVIARLGDNHHEFDCIVGVPHLHFQIASEYRTHNKEGRWGWGYFLKDGYDSRNPHFFWADGPFKVTCFEPGATYGRGTLTYPVRCE